MRCPTCNTELEVRVTETVSDGDLNYLLCPHPRHHYMHPIAQSRMSEIVDFQLTVNAMLYKTYIITQEG